MDQLEQNEDDVRDLSDDDEDQRQHHEEMEEDDDESQDDVEKVNDLDFIAQHAAEPWTFSNDVSKDVIATSVTAGQQHEGNDEEIEMNQSDDESEEEEELESVGKSVSDSSSSDDESDILEMERKTATKDTYASHKAEAASWLTEEEENMPSGPPRTRNEVDESYDVFDPSELDLAGILSHISYKSPPPPPLTLTQESPPPHPITSFLFTTINQAPSAPMNHPPHLLHAWLTTTRAIILPRTRTLPSVRFDRCHCKIWCRLERYGGNLLVFNCPLTITITIIITTTHMINSPFAIRHLISHDHFTTTTTTTHTIRHVSGVVPYGQRMYRCRGSQLHHEVTHSASLRIRMHLYTHT